MLYYSVILNGVDITDSVSIGVVTREKLAEPLDDGSLHLPISIRDIEYKIKGLLEIHIEENSVIKSFEFLVIDDDVIEGSKYGDYKHDLTVMEYSAKYDDYILHTFSSTKTLKDNKPAPFTFNNPNNLFKAVIIGSSGVEITQKAYIDPIEVIRQYYNDDVIEFLKVDKGYLADEFRATTEFTYVRTDVVIKTNAPISPNRFILSDNKVEITLPKGEWNIEYGFVNSLVSPNTDVMLYTYHVKVIDREDISIYDLIEQIGLMKSKFGGVESNLWFDITRLFKIDDNIVDYLKSVEAPQMYLQKMTVRQALNTIFSYVNSISRFTRDSESADLDILSMDEFNKVTGIFELEDGVSNYSAQRSGGELTIKGVSFLERAMPIDLEEPTIESPADDMFKMIRSNEIQMNEHSFELKLERPIYRPNKLEYAVKDIAAYHLLGAGLMGNKTKFDYDDFILDLTHRWINIEEYKLKEITTNFPSVYTPSPFSSAVGLAKNMTENLYWQEGDKSIKMSDVFGVAFQSTLIKNVIRAAIFEHLTKNLLPVFTDEDGWDKPVMNIMYDFYFEMNNWGDGLEEQLLFNVEYVSLEDIVIDIDRKDVKDNYSYYSEAKLNQTDKLVAAASATRGMSGDIQRAGTREIAVVMHHNSLLDVLKMGMFNPKERLTITEVRLNLQNEYLAATYMLSKDFNRSQMFRSILQEYRWSEIPTSNQVHDRHELYKDYLIVVRPEETRIGKQATKIASETAKLIFNVIHNGGINKHTKVTFAYVRTDGMEEFYDLQVLPPSPNRKVISTPVSSFGIKDGLSFSFGFDSNLIAGDALKIVDGNYYNDAVRYTDENGRFTKFWFALHQSYQGVDTTQDHQDYPLKSFSLNDPSSIRGIIDAGNPDFSDNGSDYLIWHKDSRQNAKLSYQISVLPSEHNLYVFGQAFFSNNHLVKNRDISVEKYIYLYNNINDYEFLKYGIFDDLKIKSGYYEAIKINPTNSQLYYENNRLKFRITNSDILDKIDISTHWAIGDENFNLYVACNENLYGFDVVERHIRDNVELLGRGHSQDFYIEVDLYNEMSLSFVLEYFRKDLIFEFENEMELSFVLDNFRSYDIGFDFENELVSSFNTSYHRSKDIGVTIDNNVIATLELIVDVSKDIDYGFTEENKVSFDVIYGRTKDIDATPEFGVEIDLLVNYNVNVPTATPTIKIVNRELVSGGWKITYRIKNNEPSGNATIYANTGSTPSTNRGSIAYNDWTSTITTGTLTSNSIIISAKAQRTGRLESAKATTTVNKPSMIWTYDKKMPAGTFCLINDYDPIGTPCSTLNETTVVAGSDIGMGEGCHQIICKLV